MLQKHSIIAQWGNAFFVSFRHNMSLVSYFLVIGWYLTSFETLFCIILFDYRGPFNNHKSEIEIVFLEKLMVNIFHIKCFNQHFISFTFLLSIIFSSFNDNNTYIENDFYIFWNRVLFHHSFCLPLTHHIFVHWKVCIKCLFILDGCIRYEWQIFH